MDCGCWIGHSLRSEQFYLLFPCLLMHMFCSKSSKLVGYGVAFSSFSSASGPWVCAQQALHCWVWVDLFKSRAEALGGAALPPRLLHLSSATGFQREQGQSCGTGFSGSSTLVTKGFCCVDLVPPSCSCPSCCEGLIRYFVLWGLFTEGVCEHLVWILSDVFGFCVDRLGFLQNSLSH